MINALERFKKFKQRALKSYKIGQNYEIIFI